MTVTLRKSWRRRRAGLTLVESLAGLVILGTLLVSVILADARLTVQSRRTEDRLEAVRIADELLGGWAASDAGIPRSGAGEVPGRPDWSWRTQCRVMDQEDLKDCEVVRLTVAKEGASEPAVAVEVLVAHKAPEEMAAATPAMNETP